MKRIITRLWMLAAVCLVVTGCGTSAAGSGAPAGAIAMQNASMVLDWYPNSDHGGIYTAIRAGMFRRHHVDMAVHVPSDTSAQIKLVASGHADFGISYETDVLAARAQGIPVQSVMCIMQHPLDTVMSLRSSHITRPRDLIGKTIGIAGDPSDEPILQAMMAADHARLSQARVVNVGYNLLPALLSKRVDAVIGVYWTWEAIQAQMKGHPVNVMRVERWGVPNYCELVMVASQSEIRARPGLVRDTVQAMQQGYAYAEAHPGYAWGALHAQDKTLDGSLVLQSLKLLRPVITGAPTIGEQNLAQWRHYAAWLYANKLITGKVDAAGAFTNRFLESHVT